MSSYLGRPARSLTARMTRLQGSTAGRIELQRRADARKREQHRAASQEQPYGLYNPITMKQRIEIEQAPKKPAFARRLLPLGVVALAAAVVTDPLVATAHRVYGSLFQDKSAQYQYAMRRSRVEHANLQAANARMRSELIALRTSRSKQGETREDTLGQKIAELEALIESVTALGVFHNRQIRPATSLVRQSTKAQEGGGELAAILNSSQLRGTSVRDESDERADGVGGAEEPCDGHAHTEGAHKEGAHKEEVALVVDNATLPQASATGSSMSPTHQQLVTRINRFISVLQLLPLGSPVQGHLSSGFGHRRSPFLHGGTFHYGVDISLKVGSKVEATGAGRVVKVAHTRTYGTMVDIEHVPGLISRYAHLSKVFVHAGQKVQRGTVIALSGNTGRSTGPHLHYEVRHNGKARNPTPFVQLAGRLSEFVNLEGRIL
jgi:murein DD-endopeptidase MepM/ murein hydrolase activator NlpD